LEFSGSPDRSSIGIFFSGYRPDSDSREERIVAVRLGTVAGGWSAVYRCIRSATSLVDIPQPDDHTNGKVVNAAGLVR
jgi:hypothetical protein